MAVAGPGSGSPLEMVEFRQGGGALQRATPGHGAIAGVPAQFVLFTGALALDPEMAAAKQAHMAKLKAALAPYTRAGHYLNFAEEQVDVSETFDTDTWARLCAVKDRLDPDNTIHANHAI